MTIIVWAPEAMAADRLSTRGDTNYFLRKLWRVGNEVIGLAGGSDYCTPYSPGFKPAPKRKTGPAGKTKTITP